MKIYLLNPPFKHKIVRTGRWQGVRGRAGGFSYPMWLSYATGVLETRYENVRLVDAIANKWNKEETLEDVVNFKPDMLVVDTNFSSTTKDMEVASFIKKNIEEKEKDVITVMVGPPTVPFVDKILNKLDIVARYEYDYTLLDIADTINACIKGNKIDKFELYEKLRNVKGISYRYHNDRNLETIHNPVRPFLASDELDKIPFVSKVYKKHLNIYAYNLTKVPYHMVQIFTGRGCPALCTFCAWPQIFTGRMYRPRSVENTLNELEYIKNEMPEIKGIFFEDDTFALDKKRIGDIADEIKKRKLKIEWGCYARANLDYITLKKMKEAGCRLFTVGYESVSETIRTYANQKYTIELLEPFYEANA